MPYARVPDLPPPDRAEMTRDTIDATLLDGTLRLVPGLVRATRSRHRRRRHRVRLGLRHQRAGTRVPEQPLHRLRLLRGGDRTRAGPGGRVGLDNVSFEVRDVTELARPTRSTSSPLRRGARPGGAGPGAGGIAEALRPDGVYLCVDVAASSHLEDNLDHPLGPSLYTVSTMHCMTVSLALDGAGLGAAWGEQTASAMLADAGFANVTPSTSRATSSTCTTSRRRPDPARQASGSVSGSGSASGCSHSHCCMRLVVMWSRSRGSPYQRGIHVSGSMTTP